MEFQGYLALSSPGASGHTSRTEELELLKCRFPGATETFNYLLISILVVVEPCPLPVLGEHIACRARNHMFPVCLIMRQGHVFCQWNVHNFCAFWHIACPLFPCFLLPSAKNVIAPVDLVGDHLIPCKQGYILQIGRTNRQH